MFKHLLPGIALAILALAPFLAQGAPSSKDTVVFDHVLPNAPGKSMRGVLVEYPPGGTSAAHTHPHSAFIYATVLEGAIRSQVNDGPVTVYTAGQNFAELPGDHHRVAERGRHGRPALQDRASNADCRSGNWNTRRQSDNWQRYPSGFGYLHLNRRYSTQQ